MLANLENSAVATGLEKVSFHCSPKKGQCRRTPLQLCSFHVLARLCPDSFKLSFSNAWTENRRTSWVSKRQRNQRSNCHHLLDHGESKRIPEKHLLCFIGYIVKLLTVWTATSCGKFLTRWENQTTLLPPEKWACRSRSSRTGHTDWLKIGKRVWQGYILSPCIQSTSCKMLGWMNHKLESRLPQQPQICR